MNLKDLAGPLIIELETNLNEMFQHKSIEEIVEPYMDLIIKTAITEVTPEEKVRTKFASKALEEHYKIYKKGYNEARNEIIKRGEKFMK